MNKLPFKPRKLTDMLSPELRERLRKALVFKTVAGDNIEPNQSPSSKKNFRFPAPDMQPPVNVPVESREEVYNTQYYTRDTRRQPDPDTTVHHPALGIEVAPSIPQHLLGSPGNNNPAVLAYDPTGTRSAMSTTHEEVNKLLNARQPTQTVRMEWEPFVAEMEADAERKGIPPPPGRPTPFDVPKKVRYADW